MKEQIHRNKKFNTELRHLKNLEDGWDRWSDDSKEITKPVIDKIDSLRSILTHKNVSFVELVPRYDGAASIALRVEINNFINDWDFDLNQDGSFDRYTKEQLVYFVNTGIRP